MKRKFKSIFTILLSAIIITTFAPSQVNAFSSDSEGWLVTKTFMGDTIADVYKYSYNSSGILTITGTPASKTITESSLFVGNKYTFTNIEYVKGQTGSDVLTIPTENINTINVSDVKVVNLNGFDTIGTTNNPLMYTGFENLETVILSDGVKKVQGLLAGAYTKKVNKLTLPSSVTEIGASLVNGNMMNHPLVIEIPATVTTIADKAIDVTDGLSNITFLCEKGSAAYNYATEKGINIELYDATTECTATLNNDISWNIITPEDINFAYSSEGWIADTWVGIQGSLSPASKLYVSTENSFDIFGETKADVQTVSVSTEDVNTTLSGSIYKTELNNTKLQSGKVAVDGTDDAYKINYKCIADSSTILRQTYKGTVRFVINEIME